MNNKALNEYKSVDLNSSIGSATPHQLIAMLFSGTQEALIRAAAAADRKDVEQRVAHINKATDIIINLKSVLDLEKGGEVAQSLDDLYDYMVRTLVSANSQNDSGKIREVSMLLAEVADGWSKIPPEEHKKSSLNS